MATNKYIGSGITFPIKIRNGTTVVETGIELVRSSLKILLSWPYGSRFYLYDFGSRLEELLEEPNDEILKDLVRYFIIEAINKFETRIILLESTIVDVTDTKISIRLQYQLINSEVVDSFVYPFYRNILY